MRFIEDHFWCEKIFRCENNSRCGIYFWPKLNFGPENLFCVQKNAWTEKKLLRKGPNYVFLIVIIGKNCSLILNSDIFEKNRFILKLNKTWSSVSNSSFLVVFN